jgi:hypothetical protein
LIQREADLVHEDAVGARADLDAARKIIRLALLVEGHHDGRRAVAADERGVALEFLLADFERDGVHDALALYAAETGLDDFPFRGVHHDRHARDVGLAGDEVAELRHGGGAVEHALVHVDIDDLRAGLDLLAGDGERRVVVAGEDELRETRGAGDVRALADVDERNFRARRERLEPAEAQRLLALRNDARLEGADGFRNLADVVGRGAAAAADDVQPPLLGPILELRGEGFWRLGKAGGRERVGQAGVWIGADEEGRDARDFLDVGPHFLRAERAIQADGEQRKVRDGIQERLDGLAGERAAAEVGNGPGNHYRNFGFWILDFGLVLEILADRVERGLGVEGVEDRFDKEDVDPALHEMLDLLAVGGGDLLEGDVARAGVVDVAGKRERAVERADGSGHENAAVGAGVGGLAGDLRGGEVQLRHEFLHAVVGHGDGRGAEGVRLDDVRAGGDVLAVDLPDDFRLRDAKQVVVALHVAGPVCKLLAAIVGLLQFIALHHRAHRSVENEDAVGKQGADFAGDRVGHQWLT